MHAKIAYLSCKANVSTLFLYSTPPPSIIVINKNWRHYWLLTATTKLHHTKQRTRSFALAVIIISSNIKSTTSYFPFQLILCIYQKREEDMTYEYFKPYHIKKGIFNPFKYHENDVMTVFLLTICLLSIKPVNDKKNCHIDYSTLNVHEWPCKNPNFVHFILCSFCF